MQKTWKAIIILAFAAFAGAVTVSNSNAGVGAATSAAASDTPANARDLFNSNCARCHGVDGTGGTELARKLDVPNLRIEKKELSTAKIVRVITNGKDDMPGFGKKMTKKQISTLAAYVRKL